MTSKLCPTCKVVQSVDEFSHSSTTKDGLNYQCITCHKARMRKQRAFNKVRAKLTAEEKRCSKCRSVKLTSEFNKNCVTADGYNNLCRCCESEAGAERVRRFREKHLSGEFSKSKEEKRCYSCKRILPSINFSTNRGSKSGLKSMCRECDSADRTRRYRTDTQYRLNALLKGAKARALELGMEFSIKSEHLTIPEFCPVLGIRIVLDGIGRSDNSPSLDRIRNDIGYVDGNVVVVSSRANRLKSDATVSELVAIASFYEGVLN